jgi:G:T-mismatch repair DNA endonuclease (very short patch repair protein)
MEGNVERERKRDKSLDGLGYKIHHVKENDYRKFPDMTIKRCVDFLSNE